MEIEQLPTRQCFLIADAPLLEVRRPSVLPRVQMPPRAVTSSFDDPKTTGCQCESTMIVANNP